MYLNFVPSQKGRSLIPIVEPWLRFSELGTWATSAFQPRGLEPFVRPVPRPRPTAGGYSSRSWPARVGHAVSRRSRRASAPARFRTSTFGQPLRIARSAWRLMFGYLVLENEMDCTLAGRVQPAVVVGSVSGPGGADGVGLAVGAGVCVGIGVGSGVAVGTGGC